MLYCHIELIENTIVVLKYQLVIYFWTLSTYSGSKKKRLKTDLVFGRIQFQDWFYLK